MVFCNARIFLKISAGKRSVIFCRACMHRTASRTQSDNRFKSALGPESRAITVKNIQKLKHPKPRSDCRTYAVLVSLCRVDGVPSLLYTLRSSDLKSHSGQVSFPGGGCDSTDRDVIHTALRETEEEIGIPQSSVDVWAVMPPIARQLDKPIFPVVGNLGDVSIADLKHNDNEVSKIFAVPLEFLCDRRNYGHTVFRRPNFSRQTAIVFPIPVFITSPRVWGLTATVTELFLSCMYKDLFPKPYGRYLPL